MPLMDGLEALQNIRLIDLHARVALVTSEKREEVVFAARAAGAVDFVAKPCDRERVARTIEKLLAP